MMILKKLFEENKCIAIKQLYDHNVTVAEVEWMHREAASCIYEKWG